MDLRKVRNTAKKIRDVFNACFNHGWFYVIVDELPIDSDVIRDFREFLGGSPWDTVDREEILSGAAALEALVSGLKNYMLPNLKELLRVSNLAPGLRISDREQYVKMRLLIEVIPANVETLELYGEELRMALENDTDPCLFDEILPLGQKIPVFVGE